MRNYKVSYTSNSTTTSVDGFIGLIVVIMMATLPAAWITHFIWVIRKLAGDAGVTVGQMVLGGLGAFFPPIGIIHGYMIWFGVGF